MLIATPKELTQQAPEGLPRSLKSYVSSVEEVESVERASKKLQRMHAAAMV